MKKTSQRQILNTKRIDQLLNNDWTKPPTKSVLSPPAQSITLYHKGNNNEAIINRVLQVIGKNSKEPDLHKAVIELMFSAGLRISEVLNIDGSAIKRNGNILIKGSKGSQNRYISPGLYREFWISRRKSVEKIGDVYSRFYWYRLFKKLGISMNINSDTRTAVTHALRYLYIQEGSENNEDITTIQQSVGHKTKAMTERYRDKNKKK